jgi:hypothetical protein
MVAEIGSDCPIGGLRTSAEPVFRGRPKIVSMSEVTVWVAGMWHVCCGPSRRVGQRIELDLGFTGEVTGTSNEDDRITILGDGRVDVTGTVVGVAGDDEDPDDDDDEYRASLIGSHGLRFGVDAALDTGSRVRCVGYLFDLPHGDPYGHTTGMLTKIRWRDGHTDDRPWLDLTSTDEQPSSSLGCTDWEFELTVVVE